MYKIGIDVGGTNTDAVLMTLQNEYICSVKSPTTLDVESGISQAISYIMEKSGVNPKEVSHVMLGTTHATNAIIQRKNLATVAVVRICLPAGQSVEPLFTWPEDLKEKIQSKVYMVSGGFEFDGRPIHEARLNEHQCREVLEDIKRSHYEAIAVSSIYSPVKNDHEKELERLAKEVLGADFPVTLSSEIGSLGLLERENSAVLNAALITVANKAVQAVTVATAKLGIDAEVFFAQNDGTLMALDYVKKYPILTIGSGPTNSIRGAGYLSQLNQCLVVDVGGTSTDIGVLHNGFPRESSVAVEIGGVRTNFRMPDIYSIGLGGGSIVQLNEQTQEVTIGPDSVGYEITRKALSWGGDTLTATDLILAAGLAEIDDPNCSPERAVAQIPPWAVEAGLKKIKFMLEDAIDKMKTSRGDVDVVLVGGGAILVPDGLAGVESIIKPNRLGCANAIGACIAQISGEADKMWSLDKISRNEALTQTKEFAIQNAIKAGAIKNTVEIYDVEEIPTSYLPGNAIRMKVKAAGALH